VWCHHLLLACLLEAVLEAILARVGVAHVQALVLQALPKAMSPLELLLLQMPLLVWLEACQVERLALPL